MTRIKREVNTLPARIKRSKKAELSTDEKRLLQLLKDAKICQPGKRCPLQNPEENPFSELEQTEKKEMPAFIGGAATPLKDVNDELPEDNEFQEEGEEGIRPNSKYKRSYCEEIVAKASEGYNFHALAAMFGVHRNTLLAWAKRHPEFKEALGIAKTKCEAYWWDIAQREMDKKFNFGVWRFVMVHVFGYNNPNKKEDEPKKEPKRYIVNMSYKEFEERERTHPRD